MSKKLLSLMLLVLLQATFVLAHDERGIFQRLLGTYYLGESLELIPPCVARQPDFLHFYRQSRQLVSTVSRENIATSDQKKLKRDFMETFDGGVEKSIIDTWVQTRKYIDVSLLYCLPFIADTPYHEKIIRKFVSLVFVPNSLDEINLRDSTELLIQQGHLEKLIKYTLDELSQQRSLWNQCQIRNIETYIRCFSGSSYDEKLSTKNMLSKLMFSLKKWFNHLTGSNKLQMIDAVDQKLKEARQSS